MRITYDASADAAYFYLAEKTEPPETRSVDEDILIDFNAENQMVGIEVLNASNRLRLSELTPSIEQIDTSWVNLTQKLHRLKDAGNSINTNGPVKWSIKEIGLNQIALENTTTGVKRIVSARKLLGSNSRDQLVKTLRNLGGYNR